MRPPVPRSCEAGPAASFACCAFQQSLAAVQGSLHMQQPGAGPGLKCWLRWSPAGIRTGDPIRTMDPRSSIRGQEPRTPAPAPRSAAHDHHFSTATRANSPPPAEVRRIWLSLNDMPKPGRWSTGSGPGRPEPAVAVAVGETARVGSLVDLVESRGVLSNRLMSRRIVSRAGTFEAEPSKHKI
jgi:hypothetical protein